LRARVRRLTIVCTAIVIGILGCEDSAIDRDRLAEKTAIVSPSHPYAGFWKRPGCSDNFGLAIAPAGAETYSVSFCGPGACAKPGSHLPDTKLAGDPDYRIIDKDTIDVRGTDGFSQYVRCEKR
jgi:hypothetical protein